MNDAADGCRVSGQDSLAPRPTEDIMKRSIPWLVLLLLLATSRVVCAMSILIPLQVGHSEAGGFAFDIAAKRQSDGTLQVHVVIAEKDVPFHHAVATLSQVIIVETSRSRQESVKATRGLTLTKEEKSLTCDFTVGAKELADPDLSFVFTSMEPRGMPSATMCYFRLKDVAKP